jgi:hypothetical protein
MSNDGDNPRSNDGRYPDLRRELEEVFERSRIRITASRSRRVASAKERSLPLSPRVKSPARSKKPRPKNDEIATVLQKNGYHDGTHGKAIHDIARQIEKDLNLPKHMANPLDAIRQRITRYYERRGIQI